MKQTAVEWLINIIDQKDWINYTTEERLKVFEQAKEIEKQQQGYSEEEVLKAQQAILCNIKDALMNENYIIGYLNNLKTK
jgi:hypothetical protein